MLRRAGPRNDPAQVRSHHGAARGSRGSADRRSGAMDDPSPRRGPSCSATPKAGRLGCSRTGSGLCPHVGDQVRGPSRARARRARRGRPGGCGRHRAAPGGGLRSALRSPPTSSSRSGFSSTSSVTRGPGRRVTSSRCVANGLLLQRARLLVPEVARRRVPEATIRLSPRELAKRLESEPGCWRELAGA